MIHFFCRSIDVIGRLLNSLISNKNNIIVNAWIRIRFGRVKHRNWGDELNYFLLREITGKNVSSYIDLIGYYNRAKYNYLVIGSIIEDFTNSNSIIWGSGAIAGEKPLKSIPHKVCAVRGKLSRNYLLSQGVECPDIYGDPALLLPLLYNPCVNKEYKLGVVPHHTDYNHGIVKLLEKAGAHIISMERYNDWHEVIDEINKCEFILSSSLHGLIVADAYRVPNVWVSIGDNIIGAGFKFKDYFSSVGRGDVEPLKLSDMDSIDDVLAMSKTYKPIKFNPAPLINAAPWKLNIKYPDYYGQA